MKERVLCLCFLEEHPRLHELAEACYGYTPQLALRGAEALFLEIGKCRGLYDEGVLVTKLLTLSRYFGPIPQIGLADSSGFALAYARYVMTDLAQLPLEALTDFTEPFHPDEGRKKRILACTQVMRMLGLQSVSDFLKMDPAVINARFGREIVELGVALRNPESVPWPRFRPVEKIEEKIDLENPEFFDGSLELLTFLLKPILDRMTARVRGRGERVSCLHVELGLKFPQFAGAERESGVRSWCLTLPVPQSMTVHLLPILNDRLSADLNQQPLKAPVSSILLRIEETTPGHVAQSNFFDRCEEEAETFDALVGRLAQKLGPDRVFKALPVYRHLPEKAWSKTLVISPKVQKTEFILSARPTRILKTPQRLIKRGLELWGQDRKFWVVKEWHGPERINGDWWEENFDRDYYQVVTEEDEKLWIFLSREGDELRLYLHGYFD